MPVLKTIGLISIAIIICAALIAALFFYHPPVPTVPKKESIAWKEDFASISSRGKVNLPNGWKFVGKPGTRSAVFSVLKDKANNAMFLHMEADKATGTLMTSIDVVDLKKTPIMRWQWRTTVLPIGADGRVRERDDQAIGLYVGTGTPINNKSVSYRWDTETPQGSEGSSAYGFGGVKIKWYTLRNKEGLAPEKWHIEERNVAEDFKRAWGFLPDKIYISVSCNSQYTGSAAAADLGWVEFVSVSGN